MRKFKSLMFIVLASSLLVACTPKKQKNNEETVETVKTTIDWKGTYEGVIADAASDGIYTLIALGDDGDYEMFQKTLNQPKSHLYKGNFQWNESEDQIILSDQNKLQFAVSEDMIKLNDAILKKISNDEELDDIYSEYYIKDDNTGNNYDVKVYTLGDITYADFEIDNKEYKLKKESSNDKECTFTDGTAVLKWNTTANYNPEFNDGNKVYKFTILGPSSAVYQAKDDNAPVKTLNVLFINPDENNSYVKVLSPKSEYCYTLTQTEASAKTAVYEKDDVTFETKVNHDAILTINGQAYTYTKVK